MFPGSPRRRRETPAPAGLTEASIIKALEVAIEHLNNGRLDAAHETLGLLNFDRLKGTASRRTGSVTHLSRVFGFQRVLETGNLIRKCQRAIVRKDASEALQNAKGALTRWKALKGD